MICSNSHQVLVGVFVALSVQVAVAQQKFFREAGETYGLDNAGFFGHAVAMADYDNDGYIDIFVGNAFDDPSVLYHNVNGTRFEEVPIPQPTPSGTAGGASWGDYDNDGDVDLYLALQKKSPHGLYRNDGGVFTNVAKAMGVASNNFEYSLHTGWVDFNNDGKLDLFTSNHGQRNNLFINQGDKFVDLASQLGISDARAYSKGFTWGDFDNDGDQDVYVVRTFEGLKGKSYLFRNDNFQLVEVGAAYHVDGSDINMGNRISGEHYGTAFGDYDNDGYLDIYASCVQGWNHLYHNEKGLDFKEVALQLRCADGDTSNQTNDFSSSCAWGDYDNDGDLDIFVPGDDIHPTKRSADRLYRNDGPAGFTEVGQEYGMGDTQEGYGCAWGDIDNDGDLDLYVAILGTTESKGANGGGFDKFWVNELGNLNSWIEINLVGTTSNRSGIGARIRCVTDTLSQIREVTGASGYVSQNMLRAHFGFAKRTNIDSIIIRWPSGTIDKYANVSVNQILTMTEGSTSSVKQIKTGPVSDYRLYQNFPNPFNPSTTICYELAKALPVSLTIYNMRGEEIRALVRNRVQHAGNHFVVWNGDDISGQVVPAGVYLYRLQVGESVVVRKMALMK
jgi:enediyne biosynthesis protein E4